MGNIQEAVSSLLHPDNNIAYAALKELTTESESGSGVYPFMDRFIEMMDDSRSYIRTRGLILIAANARWDTENKIDEIISRYIAHITDEKPITSRQCIKLIPEIAAHKPNLKAEIVEALQNADLELYPDSMQPLIIKDITAALKKIDS